MSSDSNGRMFVEVELPEVNQRSTKAEAGAAAEPGSNVASAHVSNALREGVRRRILSHRSALGTTPRHGNGGAQNQTEVKALTARSSSRRDTTGESTSTTNNRHCHKGGGRCVSAFFGQTPAPGPCGSCKYQFQWIFSGLFIALLKYVFAITCALIIHDGKEPFEHFVSIGVNVQLICMVVSQLLIAPFSEIGVTVAGPDVIAAIFTGAMAEIIEEQTVETPHQALPTLLFCIFLTTLLCALTWLLIGYFKGTRIVDYVPVAVVFGFLGCLAYKVLYYCIKVSVGHEWYHPESWQFWKLLIPVIPLGLGLYYLKKHHHTLKVSPIVLLAVFLILPPLVFYCCVWGLGYSQSDMVDEGWLFDEMQGSPFWWHWVYLVWGPSEGYFDYSMITNDTLVEDSGHRRFLEEETRETALYNDTHHRHYVFGESDFTDLNGMAIALCLPPIFTTMVVATIALLINVQATKQRMNLPLVDSAREVKVNGWANVGCALALAAPGYSQIKFNLLNWHIIENQTDKKPGLFAALFALVFMVGGGHVSGFLLVNYLPRLVPGMLLLYAAMPLVENNLILSWGQVTRKEFFAIWVIVIINAVSGVWTHYSFLIAIGCGLILATFIFAFEYGRNPVIYRKSTGADHCSDVVRPTEQKLLKKIGVRVRVLELSGFLFFGSTNQILSTVKKYVTTNQRTPFPEQVRYVLMDFTNVQNVDHSSSVIFHDIQQIACVSGITLIFTGMNQKVEPKLRAHGILMPSALQTTTVTAVTEDGHVVSTTTTKEVRVSQHNLAQTLADDESTASSAARAVAQATNKPTTATASTSVSSATGQSIIIVKATLADGIRYVEDALLQRVDAIRERWLIFDSFRKAHSEARIKTEQLVRMACETFEKVCGSEKGLDLWRYASVRTLERGQVLLRQGRRSSTLYVLQSGIVLAYVSAKTGYVRESDGRPMYSRVRKKLERCSFLNESCLYTQDAATYTAVAAGKCVLWAFTKEQRSRMQKDAPHLYMDILRKALQHSAQMIALAHELQAKSQQAAETASANHRREIQRLQSEVHGIKRSGSSGSGDDESGGAAVTSPVRLAKQPSVGAQEWKRLNQRLGSSEDIRLASDSEDDITNPSAGLQRNTNATHGLDDWASMEHQTHAFEHLSLAMDGDDGELRHPHLSDPTSMSTLVSPRTQTRSLQEAEQAEPQLSKRMEEHARQVFYGHAAHIHLIVDKASGKVARRTAIFPKQMKMNEGVQRRALTPRGNLDAGAVAAALPGDGSEVSSASTNEAVEATTKAAAEAARRNQESEEGGGRAVEAQSDGHIRLQESEVCIATESTQDERPTKRTLLVRQCSMDKYLDLRTLEHAVVDLGVYPSRQEVERMHRALAGGHKRDFADEREFLDMVRALKTANLSQQAKRRLHVLFNEYCRNDGILDQAGLAKVLTTLGHPDNESELEAIMLEWDVDGDGCIDFQALVSIMSTIMKAEEVQVQIENDFRRFFPNASMAARAMQTATERAATVHVEDAMVHSDGRVQGHRTPAGSEGYSKTPRESNADLLRYNITKDDLLRVHEELGLSLSSEIADEMLFDADINGTGVDYCSLIRNIETLSTTEIHEAMKNAQRAAQDEMQADIDALDAYARGDGTDDELLVQIVDESDD